MSADADLNYFVFQQEGHLFQSWYPDTFTEIFGRQNVGCLHGFMYKYLKSLVLNLFGPVSLQKMLPELEKTANRKLQHWSFQDTVEIKEETARVTSTHCLKYCQDTPSVSTFTALCFLPSLFFPQMIFDLTAKKLISYDSESSGENLRENFVAFIRGLISFPLDLPGTAYHKCLQVNRISTCPND